MEIYRQLPPYNTSPVPTETWAGADPDLMFYLATGQGADAIQGPADAKFSPLSDEERALLVELGSSALIPAFEAVTERKPSVQA